jgi:hypothetical protein
MSGPANDVSLLVNRARMGGFVEFDFTDRYSEAATVMAEWLHDGRLLAGQSRGKQPGGPLEVPWASVRHKAVLAVLEGVAALAGGAVRHAGSVAR